MEKPRLEDYLHPNEAHYNLDATRGQADFAEAVKLGRDYVYALVSQFDRQNKNKSNIMWALGFKESFKPRG